MFHVGFDSFAEESSCFMWVLMLFGCPELQRVLFHVGFTSFAPYFVYYFALICVVSLVSIALSLSLLFFALFCLVMICIVDLPLPCCFMLCLLLCGFAWCQSLVFLFPLALPPFPPPLHRNLLITRRVVL